MKSPRRKVFVLAWIQAVFYFTTGLWAVVDIDSFMAVTGPKVDVWLVRTVGLLVGVTGAVLALAAKRRRISRDLVLICIGQALSLAAIDVIYVSAGRISAIYLLDAGAEIILVIGWLLFWRQIDEPTVPER